MWALNFPNSSHFFKNNVASVSTLRLPAALLEPLQRSWSEVESFDYCSKLTKAHYENFPVGSVLAPAHMQKAIHSLYAFMRTADDFADENRANGDEAERLAYLESWDELLTQMVSSTPQHPIFIALKKTVADYHLPIEWLRDLLTAFKLDVTKRRYGNQQELLDYCRYSANPVGRLILTLFGYRSEPLYQLSDAICTGLQLANHWQDVAVDLAKDRIYLPQDEMSVHGLSDLDLFELKSSNVPLTSTEKGKRFQKFLAYKVQETQKLFEKGKPLPSFVRGRLRLELKLTWWGGVTVLQKIQAIQMDVFQHRPVVGKWDWFTLVFKSLIS